MVTPKSTLFATPEVEKTEIIVFAYQLGRKVKGKMLMCASGCYCFAPVDSSYRPGLEKQVYIAFGSKGVFLLHMRSAINVNDGPDCKTTPARTVARDTYSAATHR